MTQLDPVFRRFERRLDRLENIFSGWVANAPSSLRDEDLMFLEGLVSSLWQHWSLFCRRVIFASAIGCTTRLGQVIPCCVTPATWERVSYISWRVHSRGKIEPLKENADLKREPTWGDVQKVQTIIFALSPGNAAQLVSCLGSVSRGPRHVQKIRNAASHRNFQTFGDIKKLMTSYNATPISHPMEVVRWTEPSTNDFAFVDWLSEMRLVAGLLTH